MKIRDSVKFDKNGRNIFMQKILMNVSEPGKSNASTI